MRGIEQNGTYQTLNAIWKRSYCLLNFMYLRYNQFKTQNVTAHSAALAVMVTDRNQERQKLKFKKYRNGRN